MRDNIPLTVILSWPRPNYVDPPTRGHALLIVNCILISVVCVAVVLRVYTRLYIKRWFGFDDWCILIALVFTTGLTAVVILANLEYGWDRHVWDIPFRLIPSNLKVAMAAKIMFTLSATFIRASLIAFYYRLSKDSSIRWFRMALHLTTAFNAGICISFVLLAIFLCNPISAYWALVKPRTARCANEGTATLAAGVINCVADLLITLLPIPIVMALNMPLRQRLQVACLLSLGLIVTSAGVVRTYFIWKSLMDSYDETWFAYPLWISAAVEIHLGVLCACAPALRPLLNDPIRSLSRAISSLKSASTPTPKASANSNSTPSASKNSKSSVGFGRKRKDRDIHVTTTVELSEFDTTVGRSPIDRSHLSFGEVEGEKRGFDSSQYGVLPRTSDEENLLGVHSLFATPRNSPRPSEPNHQPPNHGLASPQALYTRPDRGESPTIPGPAYTSMSKSTRTGSGTLPYTMQRKGSHPWAVPTSVEDLTETLHKGQRSQSSLAAYPLTGTGTTEMGMGSGGSQHVHTPGSAR